MRRFKSGSAVIAIAYLRVSTDDQALGPAAQRAAIESWAARNGVRIASWHSDQGVSGATPAAARTGLVGALAAIRETGAGVLISAKRDRFARDVVVMAEIERAALALGATVRTADGASDGSADDESAIVRRGIEDVFASLERAKIRNRTRAALGVKRARGEKLGGHAPYGYQLAADGVRLEPREDEQATVSEVQALRASGLTLRAIVGQLSERGRVSRAGKPFALTQVARMLGAS